MNDYGLDNPEVSLAQEERYLKAGGAICPHCGSKNIEATDSLDVDGDGAIQPVTCHRCRRSWTDVYKLIGVLEAGSPREDA